MAGPWYHGGKYEHPDTPKPAGEYVKQKLHPGSFEKGNPPHRPFCGDSFGAMGACVRPKGHEGDMHADVNGNQWRRTVAPSSFVKPAGQPTADPVDTAGGSWSGAGPGAIKHLNAQQFGDIHRVWQSRN